ncbi:uncharacterized protein LOC116988320 [Amblyraja radiata]|uniref:uncharacterized protein LOC116988320 n=1 Tax=Amblyraja radiata TaxID=386614 RepID=UPI00140299AF|nr:uncharacterized protein LOC116988320 [Amblyraja radiata]
MAKLASDLFNSKCAAGSNGCKPKDSSTWSQIRTENIPNDFTGGAGCHSASPLSKAPVAGKPHAELLASSPAAAALTACLIVLLFIGLFNLKRSNIRSRLEMLCKKFTHFSRRLLACGNSANKALSERDVHCLCREIFAQEKLAKRLRVVESKLMAVEDIVVYVLDQLSMQRAVQPPPQHCKYTCCQCRDGSRSGSPFTEYERGSPVLRTTVRRWEY